MTYSQKSSPNSFLGSTHDCECDRDHGLAIHLGMAVAVEESCQLVLLACIY